MKDNLIAVTHLNNEFLVKLLYIQENLNKTLPNLYFTTQTLKVNINSIFERNNKSNSSVPTKLDNSSSKYLRSIASKRIFLKLIIV